MKLKTEQPYIGPRVPVVARLRPAGELPKIWPLKFVALMVLGIIALSAACAVVAQQAPRAALNLMDRIDAIEARMDEEQLARQIELEAEKGDPR